MGLMTLLFGESKPVESTPQKDVYDEAIEYLTSDPLTFRERVLRAWGSLSQKGGCLFAYVSPNRKSRWGGDSVGCLTTIRLGELGSRENACTPELTVAIRNDDRIPRNPHAIKPKDLPVFAEWQRRLDKELNRPPLEAVSA